MLLTISRQSEQNTTVKNLSQNTYFAWDGVLIVFQKDSFLFWNEIDFNSVQFSQIFIRIPKDVGIILPSMLCAQRFQIWQISQRWFRKFCKQKFHCSQWKFLSCFSSATESWCDFIIFHYFYIPVRHACICDTKAQTSYENETAQLISVATTDRGLFQRKTAILSCDCCNTDRSNYILIRQMIQTLPSLSFKNKWKINYLIIYNATPKPMQVLTKTFMIHINFQWSYMYHISSTSALLVQATFNYQHLYLLQITIKSLQELTTWSHTTTTQKWTTYFSDLV